MSTRLLVRCSIIASVLPFLLPLPSFAQWPQAGEIYLSFSPDGRDQDLHVEAFEPFEFHLLVDVDPAGGDPTEILVVEGELAFSSEVFLSEIDWFDLTADIGNGVSIGSYDFQLAFAGCATLSSGPNAVCSFRAILTEDAEDLFVGVGPAHNSSVDGLGPAWIGCPDQEQILVFGSSGEPLAINKPVPVESTTWSEVKALYR